MSLVFLIRNEEMLIIPDESIRFRVIANSNSNEDISVKEYLTKQIIENNQFLFKSNTIQESRDNAKKNIDNINKLVKKTFKDLNYDKDFDVNYGVNYFPQKIYKGVKYKEGYYESLVVTIGEGKGNNYFCVMFPPLCLVDEDYENVEYKFKIAEILEKFIIKK